MEGFIKMKPSYLFLFLPFFLISITAQAAPPKKNSLAYQQYSRGVELASKKKWDESIKFFQSAIDLNPSYIASYIEFARASAMLGRRRIALEKLSSALLISRQREEREKIIAERDNLSEIFYTNETFQQYQNGLNYIHLDRVNAAIDALERAKKVEPDNLLILLSYSRALLIADRLKEAVDVLETALGLNDRNSDIRISLASAYLVNSPEKALQVVRPVLGLTSDENISLIQARALSLTKKNKDAIDFLRDRAENHPSWIRSQYWLGKFYSIELDGGWNSRKYLMTFLKRTEPAKPTSGDDVQGTDVQQLKLLRADAESLLERVNKSLE